MHPDTRRIVAVDAHLRRSGLCPVRVHSLGTGESFEIQPASDGFLDVTSGLRVRVAADAIELHGAQPIRILLDGDVGFSGFDPVSGAAFTGRAGGGSSVTVYEQNDWFQFAIVTSADPISTEWKRSP